jgi:AcrR family transcriptional regulator
MPRSRPPLTRDKILETALTIVDTQGLAGLSMRKLAAELQVEAMSLYNHVKDKDDLLNGLTNLVLSRIAQPTEQLAWPKMLEYFAVSLYQAFLEHPALVTVLESSQPASLRVLQGMERVLLALKESGLSPREQVSAFRGLVAMCLGFVLAHTQGLTSSKLKTEAHWAQWDGQHFTNSHLPQLVELAPYFQETHADEDFRFMLRAYLQALQVKSAAG